MSYRVPSLTSLTFFSFGMVVAAEVPIPAKQQRYGVNLILNIVGL
jgi:hypothetical protein